MSPSVEAPGQLRTNAAGPLAATLFPSYTVTPTNALLTPDGQMASPCPRGHVAMQRRAMWPRRRRDGCGVRQGFVALQQERRHPLRRDRPREQEPLHEIASNPPRPWPTGWCTWGRKTQTCTPGRLKGSSIPDGPHLIAG
jgi:hypothetical protein